MLLDDLRFMTRTIQLMTSSLQKWCLHSRYGDTTYIVYILMRSLTIRASVCVHPERVKSSAEEMT